MASQAKGKVVVVVNPVSGEKKGRKAAVEVVVPRLEAEGYSVETLVTERAGHLQTNLRERTDLGGVGAVMVVGGDGTMHEALNGLLDNAAVKENASVPVLCVVPCGSGNALAESVGVRSVEDAVDRFIKGRRRPMDVGLVSGLPNQQPLYAFCVLSTALHADIVGTANSYLGWLSAVRFKLAFQALLVARRTVPLRLKMIGCTQITDKRELALYEDEPSQKSENNPADQHDVTYDVTVTYFLASKMRYLQAGYGVTHHTSLADGHVDVFLLEDVSRGEMIGALAAPQDGRHIALPHTRYYKARVIELQSTGAGGDRVCVDGEMYMLPGASEQPIRWEMGMKSITLAA
eukprot:comp23663_c0_seq1/m.40452 comp23663_c0_seq1/g.40452  ORF comp23663_c0_seq1/g.40452 comp23663_c0_seq1/m.40452 type:complete len:347 (-) comp23663_c0_seq1:29-1069(-)